MQKFVWYALVVLVIGLGLVFGLGRLGLGGAGGQSPTSPQGQTPESPLGQTPESPRAQTPTAPMPQTPTAPPPPPPKPVAAKPKPAPKPPVLDLGKLSELREGMSVDEVVAVLGQPGFLMSQTGDETTVYRWSEPGGAALLARFNRGMLERKNLVNAKGVEQKNAPKLTREQYDALTPGMTLPEVLVVVGIDPKSQTANQSGVSLVRWADQLGSSFSARFEDGKLVRKTGFHVSTAGARKLRESAGESSPIDGSELTDVTGQPSAPPEEEARADEAATTEASPAKGKAKAEPTAVKDKEDRKSRVRVAGGRKDGPDEGSYRPKAKLPSYAHSLRGGSFEVRVLNPTEHHVKAGLRMANRGIDLDIPPKSKRSVKLDRGIYTFYFVSDGDPYTLNSGTGINLDSMFSTDMEISIVDENFEVRPLDQAR